MKSKQIINIKKIIIVVTILVILAIVYGILRKTNNLPKNLINGDISTEKGVDPGKDKAEQFIVDYISALNKNDINVLSDLFEQSKDSIDMKERLRIYGGRNFHNVDIQISQEFKYVYSVWITAQSDDGEIKMYEVIEWDQGQWHMAPMNKEINTSMNLIYREEKILRCP